VTKAGVRQVVSRETEDLPTPRTTIPKPAATIAKPIATKKQNRVEGKPNPAQQKQNPVFFRESGLFNGLRAIFGLQPVPSPGYRISALASLRPKRPFLANTSMIT
jgi:hypothetical protein